MTSLDTSAARTGSVGSGPQLSAAKAALLENRLRGRRGTTLATSSSEPAHRSVDDSSPAPLSSGQERIWVHEQLIPGSALYTIGRALRVEAELDPDALRHALRDVVDRHEALRTVFREVDGKPTATVLADDDPALLIDDLRADVASAAAARVHEILQADLDTPFDVSRGPMARFRLLRLSGATVIAVSVHHIAADGWSLEILFDELSARYAAIVANADGLSAGLPPLPIRYSDYARRQRSDQDSAPQVARLQRRVAKLEGAPQSLGLPYDRSPSGRRTRGNGTALPEADPLPAPLTDRLRTLAAEERTTMFVPLLAAYALALHTFSGQTDLLIGVPVAGRTDPQVERIIGFFSNNVVVRSTTSPSRTAREQIRELRAEWLDAMSHQDVPFERLVEALRPDRTLRGTPLFQAAFNCWTGGGTGTFAGHPASDVASDSARVPFELTLNVLDDGTALTPVWGFDDGVLEPDTVRRFARHLLAVLTAFAAEPDLPLSRTIRVDDRDQADLAAWNRTGRPAEGPDLVHELIARHAAACPDAVAVSADDEEMTYAELEHDANRLARLLRSRGVRAGDLVAVHLTRGTAVPVVFLAVLKAGAAVMPLDPGYPAERLAHQMTDGAPSLLITTSDLADRLRAPGAATLLLDTVAAELATYADRPLDVAVSPDSTAYVVYTSGSTGKPKGALNSHRVLSNTIRCADWTVGVRPDDRILYRAPMGFDAAVWEIACTLGNGARLVITDAGLENDPARIAAVLRERRVTVLSLVPSLLRALLDEPAFGDCHDLRLVVTGGEALTPNLAQRFASRMSARLLNSYGPSECGVMVSFWECPVERNGAPILLGPPAPNIQFHVLNALLEPVPVGAIGELYIGGVQNGPGYHRRASLTAERFVPAPGGPAGARLYRTGDLVRSAATGAVEFLGRADDQLKIRGHRVELGEIEAVLTMHDAVSAAAVVVLDGPTGDPELFAWLASRTEAGGHAELVEQAGVLARRALPAAMIPAGMGVLAELPLNPHQKVDRGVLTRQAADMRRSGNVRLRSPSRRAHGPSEELVARVWAAVFGHTDFGALDDFFALGGNSLLAIQVMNRLRTATGTSLSTAALFESPTVATLATRLEAVDADDSGALVWLRRGGVRPTLVLVHPIGGSVLGYRELVGALGPDRPVCAFEGREPLPGRLADLAARYLDQLLAYGPKPPFVLGGWSFGGVVAVEMARQLRERTGTTAPVLVVDAGLPGDGDNPPSQYSRLESFVYDLARVLDLPVPDMSAPGFPGEPAEALDRIREGWCAQGLDPAMLDTATLAGRFAVFSGNAAMFSEHRPAPYDGPVFYVRASQSDCDFDAWRSVAGTLHFSQAPGDHYTVMSGAGAELVAAAADSIEAGASQ